MNIEDFNKSARDVLELMLKFEFIKNEFNNKEISSEITHNFGKAMDLYMDDSPRRPYYSIADVSSEASAEINIPEPPNNLAELSNHLDDGGYFEAMLANNQHLKTRYKLEDEDYRSLINIFYEDLCLCIESRYYMRDNPIVYFENIFYVYKEGGFPCGWKGGKGPKKGALVVLTATDQ